MTIEVVVSGATGRMGRTLARLIADAEDLALVGGLAPDSEELSDGPESIGYAVIEDVGSASALIRKADVVIDFSAPRQLAALVADLADALEGKALLVGTTGYADDVAAGLDALASGTAVLVAPNFSIGVNVLLGLAARAARSLPEGYDVEVVEAHHRHKADAPSGTALALGRAVADARGRALADVRRDGRSGETGPRPAGEIGFHALRGGERIGEHAVRFQGAREEVVLSHTAHDRALFAEGALVAARWIAGREPGRYTMADVLGLEA